MADKYLENETFSFEKIIELYENTSEISKIVIQKNKEGLTCKRNKDIVYISTDKTDDEILSIIAGAKKVVFEEQEKEEQEKEDKEKDIYIDPKTLNALEMFEPGEEVRELKRPNSKKKQRFTFKKVKINVNELLNKLEVLKKESPEKFEKIPSDFKEKLKQAIEKGKIYIALGLAALTLIGIGIGIGINMDKPGQKQTTTPSQIEETIPFNTEETTSGIEIEKKETIQGEQNEIDTISEVEEDFIKDYLDAYNEKYGTEYTEAELLVTNLKGTSLYQLLDGRKITRGNLPYETEKVLEELGGYESIPMNNTILQVVLPSGNILGTYDITTGEFIYSGNQLEDLKNEDFEAPELEDIGVSYRKVGATGRLIIGREVEDEISTKMRIEEYKEIDKQDER